MATSFYSSKAWKQLQARRLAIAEAGEERCCRCHRPINYELRYPHRLSPSADHLMPRSLGGEDLPDLSELGAAHYICNSRHGGRIGNRLQRERREKAAASAGRGGSGLFESDLEETRPPAATPPKRTVRYEPPAQFDPYSPPRLETPPPGHVTGTLGDQAINEINARRGEKPLRPWQEHVLRRALEVDSNGDLVWRRIVVSTARQAGKSTLLSEWIIWRAMNDQLFGEPQSILHISKNLQQARAIQSQHWRWAEANGLTVRRANGSEGIDFPNGSSWFLSSFQGVYGHSSGFPVADEAWALSEEAVQDGLLPVLLERPQSQLLMLSTAHAAATSLVPKMRQEALETGGVLLLEWSAAKEDDVYDQATWMKASPHWTHQRGEILATQVNSPGFREQYLNRWSWGEPGESPSGWQREFSALPKVPDEEPRPGLVAAIETDLMGKDFGVAFARMLTTNKFHTWVYVVPDLEEALAILHRYAPHTVFAGKSISERVVGPFAVQSIGQRETGLATPLVGELSRAGAIAHNHDETVRLQSVGARAAAGEHGPVLSARRSQTSICGIKAMAWAIFGTNRMAQTEAPAIF